MSVRNETELNWDALRGAILGAAYNYRIIQKNDRVLVALKDHPLASLKRITPEQIAQHPLLLPPKGANTRDVVEKVFKGRGLEMNLALEATGREAIKSYVALGFGVSILNELYVSKMDRTKFFTASVANYFGQSERGFITLKRKTLPVYINEFIELVAGMKSSGGHDVPP